MNDKLQDQDYTIEELARAANDLLLRASAEDYVPCKPRTIRFYGHAGLLPRPIRRQKDKHAYYTTAHLNRLLVLLWLREHNRPLGDIHAMTDDEVARRAAMIITGDRSLPRVQGDTRVPPIAVQVVDRIALLETQRVIIWVNHRDTMEPALFTWLQRNACAIVVAHSTARAMDWLWHIRPDAIIGNLRRVEHGVLNPEAGIDLARQVRRINTETAVCIYTAQIDNEVRARAREAGANWIGTTFQGLQKALGDFGFVP